MDDIRATGIKEIDGRSASAITSELSSVSKTIGTTSFGIGIGSGAGYREGTNGSYTIGNVPTTINGAASVASTTSINFTGLSGTGGTGNATSFRIYNVTDNKNTVINGASGTVTGLSIGKKYTFRVYATNEYGESTAYKEIPSVATVLAPGAVTISTITRGNKQLTVNWTAPAGNGENASKYKLESSTDGKTWTTVSDTITGTSHAHTGLATGTTYQYRVSAYNSAGWGAAGAVKSAKTYGLPGTPTPTVAADTKALNISWLAVDGDGQTVTYEVYEVDGSTETKVSGNTALTATSFKHTGLENNSTHTYKVKAITPAGTVMSGTASGTTHSVPAVPTDVTAAVTKVYTDGDSVKKAQVTVTWNAPTSNGGTAVTGYKVSWYANGTFAGSETVGSVSQYVKDGLPLGTSYTFRVAALNAAGEGPEGYGTNSMVTTWNVPDPVRSVTGTSDNGALTLNWQEPANNNGQAVTQYAIYVFANKEDADADNRDKLVNIPGSSNPVIVSADGSTSKTIQNLPVGETYFVRISATNSVGESTRSPSYEVGVNGPPSAVSGIKATAVSDTEIEVTWSPANANGQPITKYVVEALDVNASNKVVGTAVFADGDKLGTETQKATISGLTTYRDYKIRIYAVNAQGDGDKLESTPCTTLRVPFEPQGVSAKPTGRSGEVEITWQPPEKNGGTPVTGYNIYRLKTENGVETLEEVVIKLDSNVRSYTAKDLVNGTDYTFVVTAVNAIGTTRVGEPGDDSVANQHNGNNTDAATPRRPADGPAAVRAVIKSGQSVQLTWSAPEDLGGAALEKYTVTVVPVNAESAGTVGEIVKTDSAGSTTVTGLTMGGTYQFKVHAVTVDDDADTPLLDGADTESNTVVMWRLPNAPDVSRMTAEPTNRTGETKVTWYYPEDDGDTVDTEAVNENHTSVSKYHLYYRVKGESSYSEPIEIAQGEDQSAALDYTVTGLTDGTEYEFVVAAVNGAGEGEKSQPSLTATPRRAPEAPGVDGYAELNADETLNTETPYGAVTGDGRATLRRIIPAPENDEGKLGDGGDPITEYRVYATEATATLVNGFVTAAKAKLIGSDGEGQPVYAKPVLKTTIPVAGLTEDARRQALTDILVPELENGKDYILSVTAVNGAGEGAASNETGVRVGMPETPDDLRVALATSSATASNLLVQIEYNDANGNGSAVTQYDVEVVSEEGTKYGDNGVMHYTSTSNLFTGTMFGETLTLRVRSVNQYGASTWSEPVRVIVGSPEIPVITNTVLHTDSVDISWEAVSNNGSKLERYLVYLDGQLIKALGRGDAGYAADGVMTLNIPKDGSNNAGAITGELSTVNYGPLKAGSTYRLQIAAQNVAGVSPLSKAAEITFGVPQAPAVQSVQFADGSLTVRWKAPADDGGSPITAYRLYANGALKNELLLTDTVASPDELTAGKIYYDEASGEYAAKVTGLANGVDYNIQVSAVNANGEGALSSAANNETPAKLAEAPRNLVAQPTSDTTAGLTWFAPSYNGGSSITDYVVKAYKVAQDGTATQATDVTVELAENKLSASVSGLTRGGTYYFTVHAVNKVNAAAPDEGNYASSEQITTFRLPGAPEIVKLESIAPDVDNKNNWSVRVTWDAPADNGGTPITGYQVYLGTVRKSGLIDQQSFVLTGLNYNQKYDRITVEAVNSVGATKSGLGSILVGQLTPPEVTSITTTIPADDDTDTSIDVRWNKVDGVVDGYRIFTLPETVTTTAEADAYLRSHTADVTTKELSGQLFSRWSGETVRLCVVAYNADMGNSPVGRIHEFVMGATSEPRGLHATPGKQAVTLNWGAPASDNGGTIKGYQIFVNGQLYQEAGTDTFSGLEKTIPGLTGGENYTFTVRAVSEQSKKTDGDKTVVCHSLPSAAAEATPWDAPSAPKLKSVTPGDGSFTLTFAAADGKGLTVTTANYDIYLRAVDDEAASPVKWEQLNFQENGDGTVTVTVADVENGKDYYVYAVAWTQYNSASDVNYSAAPDLSNPAVTANAELVQKVRTGALAAPAITGVTAGVAAATVTYSAPSDTTGSIRHYVVSYQTGGEPAKTVTSTTTSCHITGLTNGLLYKVTVRAVNDNGDGAESEAVEVRVGTPLAPRIGTPQSGDGEAKIVWDPPAANNGGAVQMYKVYMTDEHGATSFVYADAGKTEAVLDELKNGVRYTVQVAAINVCGEGAKSAPVEVMPGTVPGAVDAAGIKATAMGADSVQLTWSAPDDTGGLPITGYRIAGGNLTEPLFVTDTTNTLVQGLTKGETYTFSVSAVNVVGAGPAVNSPAVRTLTEPGAPAWRALSSANGTFNARWQTPSSDGGAPVLEYLLRVYKAGEQTPLSDPISVTPDDSNTADNIVQYTGEPGSYEIGTEYEVTVTARNSVGTSGESSRLAVLITGAVAASVPGKPYNVTAAAGNATISVSWSKPLYDGNLTIDGYRVYYYETDNKDETLKSQAVNGGGTTSATIGNLKNGVAYSVYVLANNAKGNSVPSDTAEATPYYIPAPGKPTGLTYKNNNTFNIMTISWNAPEGKAGELRYNVYINGELMTTEDYTSTSYTFQVPDANIGALYNIQVEAVSEGGVSEKEYIKARSTLNVMSNNIGEPDTNLDLNPLDGELDEAAAATAPGAPVLDTENSRMLSAGRKLHLEWAAPGNDGGARIEGYRIYINSSKGGTVYDFSPENGNDLSALEYEAPIESGVIYVVRISAYNEAGEGANSDSLQMYLAMSNAPTDLRAAKTSKTGIKLTWSAPNAEEKPTEYVIQMNGEDQAWSVGTETSYQFGGAVNKNYIFRVYAKYGEGEQAETSKTTDAVRVSTVLLQPSAPTGLTAEVEKQADVPTGKVELKWNASAEDAKAADYSAKVTGYEVYVNNTLAETVAADGSASYTYTYEGMANEDYVIHVTAINAADSERSVSAKSNVVSATTQVPKPNAPSQISDLTAAAEQSDIDDRNLSIVPVTLTWTPSTLETGAQTMEEPPAPDNSLDVPEQTEPTEPPAPDDSADTTDSTEPPVPDDSADTTDSVEPPATEGSADSTQPPEQSGADDGQPPANDQISDGETVELTDGATPLAAIAQRIAYAIRYSTDGGATWDTLSIEQSDIGVVDGKCVYQWNDEQGGAPARGEYTFVVVPTAYVDDVANGTDGLSSNSATVSTVRQVPLPDAPKNVKSVFADDQDTAQRPSGTITVTWDALSGAEDIQDYNLYIDSVKQNSAVRDGNQFTFRAQADKYAYAIQVSAVNENSAEGPLSEVSQLNIPRDGETDLTVPDAAEAVKFERAASNGTDEIRLFWTASGDPQTAGYQIYVDGKLLVTADGTAVTLGTDARAYTFGGKDGDNLLPFYVLDGDSKVEQYVTSGKHTVQVSAIKYFSPTEGVLTDADKIAASADKIIVPGALSNAKLYEWTMVVGLNVATNTDKPEEKDYWVADTNIDADGDGTRDTIGKVVRLTGKVTATGSAASVAPVITLTDAYDNQTAGTYDAETGAFAVEVNLGTVAGDEAAGTYTLTVSKDKCTTFTMTDIDLSGVTDSADIGEALLYAGDLDGNNVINVDDLLTIKANLNKRGENVPGDIDGNNVTNVDDLLTVKMSLNKRGINKKWA
ncbi:MAG: fibronectin type III domain-containing protein [Eubacteriales bacterium]|nr:fibronectin type III domain-containing protein [Eubacteriales bacterium]